MSWVFVAFIPGLLMLATFGLDRIENRLERDLPDTDDLADYASHPKPGYVRAAARDGAPTASDGVQRRRAYRADALPVVANHSRAYSQFRPTRHADSV